MTLLQIYQFAEKQGISIDELNMGHSANKEIEQLILKHIADFEKRNGAISFDDGFAPRSRS